VWWVGAEVWQLFVGRASCGLQRPGRGVQWRDDGNWAALLREAKVPRSRWRRPVLRAWLSGGLAKPFLLGPLTGLAGDGERGALAQARAQEVTALEGPCEVAVEGDLNNESALCVAVQAALVDALHAACAANALRMASCRPWWAGALDVAIPTQAKAQPGAATVLALTDPEAMTVLAAASDTASTGPRWLASEGYCPLPEPEQRGALVQRRLLALPASDAQVLWIDAQAPSHVAAVTAPWPEPVLAEPPGACS
jgi:hypothetical protein